MLGEEGTHRIRDLLAMGFQGEMAGIEQADLRIREITLERLRARGEESSVVLAPDREQRRPARTQELLILWILLDIGPVVGEQVELEFVIARARQQGIVERKAFGRDQRLIRVSDPAEIPPLIGC